MWQTEIDSGGFQIESDLAGSAALSQAVRHHITMGAITMNGTNAAGRRISLLSEEAPRAPALCPSKASPGSRLVYLPHPHPHPHPYPVSHSHALPGSGPAAAASTHRPGPRPLVHPYVAHSTSTRDSSSSSRTSSTHSHCYSSSSSQPYHSDSDSSLSRHSSIASPRFSPSARAVPHLSRLDSSSSARSLATPSPMTPAGNYEPYLDPHGKASLNIQDPSYSSFANPLTQPQNHHGLAAAMSVAPASNAPYYPSSAQGSLPVSASQTNMFGGFPALQQAPFDDTYASIPPAQVQYQFATNLIDPTPPVALPGSLASPTSLSSAPIPPVDPNSTSASNGAGSTTKAKKKYPCPHAAKFNCHDTFTTSGHAARHGKKHTGEKNILCPTCHKAFTRKDNMKQHERTHKNNRNNDSVDHGKSNPASGTSRRTHSISSVAASTMTHKSSNSIDMDVDSPTVDGFDSKRSSTHRPNLARPGQYSGTNSTGSGDFKYDLLQQRPELNRQFSGESQDGEGESPGLDALAMAATSELR